MYYYSLHCISVKDKGFFGKNTISCQANRGLVQNFIHEQGGFCKITRSHVACMQGETRHQRWKEQARDIVKREINSEITGKLCFPDRTRAHEEP